MTVCCVCVRQIKQAGSGLQLTEEQFIELQTQQWKRFYSSCVQYHQVITITCSRIISFDFTESVIYLLVVCPMPCIVTDSVFVRCHFLAMSDVRQWAWSPLTTNKSLTYLLTFCVKKILRRAKVGFEPMTSWL